ncbi:MAG: protein-L-isoaspartate O-methyltransferase [Nitrospinota bacterium]|nr:protein-L-isoaspartate O-methyltransferase [Nitrospinota bacterium]
MASVFMRKQEDLFLAKRIMIEKNLKGRDIVDPRVLAAMESVPREKFIPLEDMDVAYSDFPLSIGHGQTISQPYIVALMAQSLQIGPQDTVLEIGAGCGYQAAVLSCLASKVYTLEIIEVLAKRAEATLRNLGYDNVHVIHADGTHGWPKGAPYDRVIAAATAKKIPRALEDQLGEGGRIIIPLGQAMIQDLVVGVKREGKVDYTSVTAVRFVPMTGDALKL